MRFTYTQAYEHLAKQNRSGEQDIDDKFKIIGILRSEFGLYGLTGEVVPIGDDFYRLPDVFVKKPIPIAIELDGGWHGTGDKITQKPRDVERGCDYEDSGVKLIIINKEQTKGYKTKLVIESMVKQGLKPKNTELQNSKGEKI